MNLSTIFQRATLTINPHIRWLKSPIIQVHNQAPVGCVPINNIVSSPANIVAQAFLIGGTAVITLLGGLYLTMHLRKRREEERGTNPYRTDLFFLFEILLSFSLISIFQMSSY